MKFVFLSNLFHAYAQTDGSYAFPNSREGDMLRQAKREVEALEAELKVCQSFHSVAVAERNQARHEIELLEADEIRLNWLEKHWCRWPVRLRFAGQTIRDAIDAARKEKP